MTLVEIADLGKPHCYTAAVREGDGWRFGTVNELRPYPRNIAINVDNVISVERYTCAVGTGKWGKNPLKRSFWDRYEAECHVCDKTRELDLFEISMAGGGNFYVDATKKYDWMKVWGQA